MSNDDLHRERERYIGGKRVLEKKKKLDKLILERLAKRVAGLTRLMKSL